MAVQRPVDQRAVAVDVAHGHDFDELASAFADWPKPRELFEEYRRRNESGAILVLLARTRHDLAGYCLVNWHSTYPEFARHGVPEITDLNVLPWVRGRGAGRLLLSEAERHGATRSGIVGLRVGLYADYGIAQAMYARAGYVPDGRGVSIRGQHVPAGTDIRLDDDAVLAMTKAVSS